MQKLVNLHMQLQNKEWSIVSTSMVWYWKVHKPVCFIHSYVLSVTQQYKQKKNSIKSILWMKFPLTSQWLIHLTRDAFNWMVVQRVGGRNLTKLICCGWQHQQDELMNFPSWPLNWFVLITSNGLRIGSNCMCKKFRLFAIPFGT